MDSILADFVALDSNVYVFGIVGDDTHSYCERLLFEHIGDLRLFVPRQVVTEVHRNLPPAEQHIFYELLESAAEVDWDFRDPPGDLLAHYELLGAKKGDAAIAAEIHAAAVPVLVSENRHFLNEIRDLPFKVVSASETLDLLAE